MFIVIMRNIYNLIDWNSVHIFDISNYYRANINGMWNVEKLGEDMQNLWIYTNLKHTFVGIG